MTADMHIPCNPGGWRLVSIRNQQQAYFGADRTLATGLLSIANDESHTLARSMGANGVLVRRPAELAGALAAALASGRPTELDVHADPNAKTPAAAAWDLPPLPHPAPHSGWPDDPAAGDRP